MNKNIKSRIGEKHITNEGYVVEIVEYFDSQNCTIRFEDSIILKNIPYDRIKRGHIKNNNNKSVVGVGYIGYGKYSTEDKIIYITWRTLITRVYSNKNIVEKPTYKDVTVCEEWHDFQNFAEWFYENYNPETMDGWQLDKDILQKGNKMYSPETCCFVPKRVNTLFVKCDKSRSIYGIGVVKRCKKYSVNFSKNGKTLNLGVYDTIDEAFQAYKTAKEQHIKEVADEWKDLINSRVYQAMYSWKIEITD